MNPSARLWPIAIEISPWLRRPVCRSMAVLTLVLLSMFAGTSRAQTTGDLTSFVGRWKIDLSRTTMNRMGPNGKNLVRSPTFTFVFAPAPTGLQMSVYAEYPGPASRTTPIVPDHKLHVCNNANGCQTVGGDPAEQTFVYYQIDGHMLARIFYIRGQPSEYTTYAVSADAKTFTMVTWSAETPEWQNIQVFEKQH